MTISPSVVFRATRLFVYAALFVAFPIAVGGPAQSQLLALHVSGAKLVDSSDQPFILRGVDLPVLERSVSGNHPVQLAVELTKVWHANLVRLPLCEDSWFGRSPGQKDDGAAYRALVHAVANTIRANSAYALLDLAWSDADRWGADLGPHDMADQHSMDFWKSVAENFLNQPGVLFELYAEPHGISWDVWKNGGEITDHSNPNAVNDSYATPGMELLIATVRATGARNVIVADVPVGASDLSELLTGYALTDPAGNGIMYASRFDTASGGYSVDQWIRRIEPVERQYPVIAYFDIGGSRVPGTRDSQSASKFFAAARTQNINWIAEGFYPQASPSLIRDRKYAPTNEFGAIVRKALAGGG